MAQLDEKKGAIVEEAPTLRQFALTREGLADKAPFPYPKESTILFTVSDLVKCELLTQTLIKRPPFFFTCSDRSNEEILALGLVEAFKNGWGGVGLDVSGFVDGHLERLSLVGPLLFVSLLHAPPILNYWAKYVSEWAQKLPGEHPEFEASLTQVLSHILEEYTHKFSDFERRLENLEKLGRVPSQFRDH